MINDNLDINYTAAQETTINTDLDSAKNEVQTVIGAPLNLSMDERKKTPSVDEQRESYVIQAVNTFGVQYPNLLGPEITLARAQKLWAFRNTSMGMLAKVAAINDLLIDTVINAENICLKFTEDMRNNAERFKDRNVPGADVVWEALKDLHKVELNPPEEVIP